MATLCEGGLRDFTAARNRWVKGARLGDSRCAFNLGFANGGGHGAAPDFKSAYAWFSEAKRLGNASAVKELNKLRSVMTNAEIAETQMEFPEDVLRPN